MAGLDLSPTEVETLGLGKRVVVVVVVNGDGPERASLRIKFVARENLFRPASACRASVLTNVALISITPSFPLPLHLLCEKKD